MEIAKQFTFEAGHILPNHQGKCRRLHGHSYRMEVAVGVPDNHRVYGSGSPLEGMVMDFGDLKEVVKRLVVDPWDHHFLARGDEKILKQLDPNSDDVLLVGVRTTAENLAAVAAMVVYNALRIPGSYVRVSLNETQDSRAIAVAPGCGIWLSQYR